MVKIDVRHYIKMPQAGPYLVVTIFAMELLLLVQNSYGQTSNFMREDCQTKVVLLLAASSHFSWAIQRYLATMTVTLVPSEIGLI